MVEEQGIPLFDYPCFGPVSAIVFEAVAGEAVCSFLVHCGRLAHAVDSDRTGRKELVKTNPTTLCLNAYFAAPEEMSFLKLFRQYHIQWYVLSYRCEMTCMVGGTSWDGHGVNAQDLHSIHQPVVSKVVFHPLV